MSPPPSFLWMDALSASLSCCCFWRTGPPMSDQCSSRYFALSLQTLGSVRHVGRGTCSLAPLPSPCAATHARLPHATANRASLLPKGGMQPQPPASAATSHPALTLSCEHSVPVSSPWCVACV